MLMLNWLSICHQKVRKEEARKVLEKADKMMLQENMPYGMISRGNMHNRNSIAFLEACYRADDKALAAKVLRVGTKRSAAADEILQFP